MLRALFLIRKQRHERRRFFYRVSTAVLKNNRYAKEKENAENFDFCVRVRNHTRVVCAIIHFVFVNSFRTGSDDVAGTFKFQVGWAFVEHEYS